MKINYTTGYCIAWCMALIGATNTMATCTEKKIVVVVTSFNNRLWYEKNVGSLFDQRYSNYHIVYIDDCSTDGTPELVEQYVKNRGQQNRFTLIKNKTRQRALCNLYNAVVQCHDDDIVINYDGDDWLAHDGVFAMFNELYQDSNVWITYGQYENWPTGELGYCQPVPEEWVEKQWYRRKWWKPGQLRTFYAWLFKQIQLKDLFFEGPYFQGQFFPANADLAIYYPMMELAGTRYRFISEIIYIRNVQTPINDFKANKDVQILGSKILRGKPVYPRLEQSLVGHFDQYRQSKAAMIIFSQSPERLEMLLKSIAQLVYNYGCICVLYEAHDEATRLRYQEIMDHAGVDGFDMHNRAVRPTLMACVARLQEKHLLLAHDTALIHHHVDLGQCIYQLEATHAYGVYLGLHEHAHYSVHSGLQQPVAPCNPLGTDMLAWAFGYADDDDWARFNSLHFALYRVADVYAQWSELEFDSIAQLRERWTYWPLDREQVGLCFKEPMISFFWRKE